MYIRAIDFRSVEYFLRLISFLNALQTAQADTHKKIVQAVDERDILHEADVRAAQEQYSREMANIREELMEARKR